MQDYAGPGMQRRRGLDVEPADVKHRQIREHDVAAGHVVGGGAVDGVVHQCPLGQHRPFGPAGRARGVDDQDRVVGSGARIAVEAVGGGQKFIERLPAIVHGAVADHTAAAETTPNLGDADFKFGLDEQYGGAGVVENIGMLVRRLAPV